MEPPKSRASTAGLFGRFSGVLVHPNSRDEPPGLTPISPSSYGVRPEIYSPQLPSSSRLIRATPSRASCRIIVQGPPLSARHVAQQSLRDAKNEEHEDAAMRSGAGALRSCFD